MAPGASASRATGASSSCCRKKGRLNMPRTKRGAIQPVAPPQALQMLQSAIGYCQMAGLAVQAANSDAGLVLTVPGVAFDVSPDGASAEFRLAVAGRLDTDEH